MHRRKSVSLSAALHCSICQIRPIQNESLACRHRFCWQCVLGMVDRQTGVMHCKRCEEEGEVLRDYQKSKYDSTEALRLGTAEPPALDFIPTPTSWPASVELSAVPSGRQSPSFPHLPEGGAHWYLDHSDEEKDDENRSEKVNEKDEEDHSDKENEKDEDFECRAHVVPTPPREARDIESRLRLTGDGGLEGLRSCSGFKQCSQSVSVIPYLVSEAGRMFKASIRSVVSTVARADMTVLRALPLQLLYPFPQDGFRLCAEAKPPDKSRNFEAQSSSTGKFEAARAEKVTATQPHSPAVPEPDILQPVPVPQPSTSDVHTPTQIPEFPYKRKTRTNVITNVNFPDKKFEPASVSSNPKTGYLYIADKRNHMVHVLDSQGNLIHQYRQREGFLFRSPSDAALMTKQDGSHHMVVADTGHNRVQVYPPDQPVCVKNYKFGPRTKGSGNFHHITGVACDSELIFVCDYKHFRIFDAKGEFVDEFTHPGIRLLKGIDVRNGRCVVSDMEGHHLYVFNSSTGEFLKKVGRASCEQGQMEEPGGLVVDKHGYILATDFCNKRVVVFNPDLESVYHEFKVDGQPTDVALSPEGNVVVAAFINGTNRRQLVIYSDED